MTERDVRDRAREALDGIGKLSYLDGSQWVVQEANGCTCCGLSPHEPGCGYEPIGKADKSIGELVCTTVDLVRELLDALDAAHAENEQLRSYKSLPVGMVWRDYYSPDDVIKIRRPLDDEIEQLRAEVERLRGNQRVEIVEGWHGLAKGSD